MFGQGLSRGIELLGGEPGIGGVGIGLVRTERCWGQASDKIRVVL